MVRPMASNVVQRVQAGQCRTQPARVRRSPLRWPRCPPERPGRRDSRLARPVPCPGGGSLPGKPLRPFLPPAAGGRAGGRRTRFRELPRAPRPAAIDLLRAGHTHRVGQRNLLEPQVLQRMQAVDDILLAARDPHRGCQRPSTDRPPCRGRLAPPARNVSQRLPRLCGVCLWLRSRNVAERE